MVDINNHERIALRVKDLKVEIKLQEGLLTPVRGVDFLLSGGETLGLVGESGCGKSLTSKAILGINTKKCKTSGSVIFNDGEEDTELLDLYKKNPKEALQFRGKKISMIFQEPMSAFSPLYTIGNQISEAVLLHMDMTKEEAKEKVLELMTTVGITNPARRYDQYPHEFSGGMLQRALIAMALICRPELLIADEPTTALDVTIQAQILKLLRSLQKEFGMSVLYITHDLGTVAQTCDNVAVMYLGKIIEYGDVKTIFKNPLHPYTRGLMGSVHKIGGAKEKLFSIKGTVPLAMNLPPGCSFCDRCSEEKLSDCSKKEPEFIEVEKGHFVACFHHVKENK